MKTILVYSMLKKCESRKHFFYLEFSFIASLLADETGASIDKPLATLVYIHGESYEWNSGNLYDGTVFAAHSNIIVVTINFRLGVLGESCILLLFHILLCVDLGHVGYGITLDD